MDLTPAHFSPAPAHSTPGTVDGLQPGNPGTPTVSLPWGSIVGNLSNQTDLTNALAAKANTADLNSHVSDQNNPHVVTKAQIGLGNVDDTSDMDKPVSIATAAAIAGVSIPAGQITDASALGRALLTNVTAAEDLDDLGAGANGKLLFAGATAADNRTNLGGTAVGSSLFTAVDAAAARNAIGAGRLINVQRLTASGTYTPTAGAVTGIVELIGGGGAGGGSAPTAAGQQSAGAPGGSGAHTKAFVPVLASTSYVIGAGGVPVNGGAGGNGSATSFGAITAPGGIGGALLASTAGALIVGSGAGGPAGVGGNIYAVPGQQAPMVYFPPVSGGGVALGTQGAAGPLGGGGGTTVGSNSTGVSGVANTGAGGGGTGQTASLPALTGGAGGSGLILVYEFS